MQTFPDRGCEHGPGVPARQAALLRHHQLLAPTLPAFNPRARGCGGRGLLPRPEDGLLRRDPADRHQCDPAHAQHIAHPQPPQHFRYGSSIFTMILPECKLLKQVFSI